ncbi:unnamed protein product [Rotaria sp. Silwood1]|nr:unnamed protein product [Rotaria sp. Silwood1]CAF1614849.1 unnamed protein product [Rotaria sp. Silwood1]CAF3691698.1 unnamed protein product [Rotaria sp. Silwood1]CAF3731411.1 unnamed protein product [Rotaria sp. Silwood1]CAF3751724.1 unnamed protein product [Rotaria sp. Silwood1]
MSNITIVSTTAIALNLISLIGTIFIGLICIFILSMLLPSIVRQRDVVLILVVNNYLALLTFALIAIPMNIDMARGDYNLSIGMETFSCRVKGYLFYASIAIVFNNLTLQAVFRFLRIVYPTYIWLQNVLTYLVIIPTMWLMSFLFILPVHVWHDIQFIRMENTCFLVIYSARGFILCTIIMNCIPVIIMNILYLQLKRFIRRTTTTISARSKRDLIVLMLIFTDVGKPIFYRLQYVIAVIVMIVLSFLFVLVTPQAKAALVCFHKPNKVTSLYEQQCVSASKAIKY